MKAQVAQSINFIDILNQEQNLRGGAKYPGEGGALFQHIK